MSQSKHTQKNSPRTPSSRTASRSPEAGSTSSTERPGSGLLFEKAPVGASSRVGLPPEPDGEALESIGVMDFGITIARWWLPEWLLDRFEALCRSRRMLLRLLSRRGSDVPPGESGGDSSSMLLLRPLRRALRGVLGELLTPRRLLPFLGETGGESDTGGAWPLCDDARFALSEPDPAPLVSCSADLVRRRLDDASLLLLLPPWCSCAPLPVVVEELVPLLSSVLLVRLLGGVEVDEESSSLSTLRVPLPLGGKSFRNMASTCCP
jgi:hypothetical protein